MEYIIFIFLIVLLMVIITHNGNVMKQLEKADKRALRLEEKFAKLLQGMASLEKTDVSIPPVPETKAPKVEDVIKEMPVEPVKEVEVKPEVTPIPSLEERISVLQESSKIKPVYVPEVQKQKVQQPVKPPKPKKPTFLERNPDLEKFIGENLINKIGIAILVLGIGFFVKYAIDQQWINEIGRVAIGIACGGILIAIAHRLRHSFNAFSSVLVGGGLAVFYFTITIAFQEYHIFSQLVAFILMVVITGFAVLLSIAYNRQELAVLAIVGGFVSPMLLSTGEGNYITLFTYVLILNVGMIVLAYFKNWNIVNIASYGLTILLYGAWLTTKVIDTSDPHPPYGGALAFASVFYVVFFVMNIVNNLKENRKFVAAEIMVLISNTFLYYSSGMLILKNIDGGLYQGLFTLVIGLFNFIFAFTLYKSNKADRNLIYLLIGMVLTFVSLAAPVQLEGNYITLFWAAEAVLLLWLSQKSGIQLIKVSAVIVNILMLVSLVMDWFKFYEIVNLDMAIVGNKVFITGIVALVSLVCTLRLLKNESGFFVSDFQVSEYRSFLSVVCIVFTYLVFLLELNFQLNGRVDYAMTRLVYLFVYHFVFVLIFMSYVLRKNKEVLTYLSVFFTVAISLAYASFYHEMVTGLRNDYLMGGPELMGPYYTHYLLSALLLILVTCCGILFKRSFTIDSAAFKAFFWISSMVVLALISVESGNILVSIFYTEGDLYRIENNIFQIAYPIIWGLCSFLAMYIGMTRKIKTYRIISLAVFSITLLKLFIFDVTRMSEGGKIAAFISLGVLLLIISFMYQKLKKIIIQDDEAKA